MMPFALKQYTFNLAATPTTVTLVSAVSGAQIRVYAIHFRTTTARTVTIRSGSTALIGPIKYAANNGLDLAVSPAFGGHIIQTASGASLKLNRGATGTALAGLICYYEYKGT